tara:strand:+ start:12408 stop:12674 length:267 start_codon:yes stop_codon:yes gene_type:complete
MDNKLLYSKEIYTTDYRIDWSDQKIIVNCFCGETDIEVFSDSYTYCEQCGRRFSIVELIQVETSGEVEEDGVLDPLGEMNIGDSKWDG